MKKKLRTIYQLKQGMRAYLNDLNQTPIKIDCIKGITIYYQYLNPPYTRWHTNKLEEILIGE